MAKKGPKAKPSSSRRTKSAKTKSVTRQMETLKIAPMATPFADVGGTVGGSLFGPVGRNVGRWLGSGIGSVFGSGDYVMPKYNILANQGQAPKFVSNGMANTVCHREYLGDVSGSTTFTGNAYSINPGIGLSFPWLSVVAENYEQYKFHGLIYEFRTTSSEYNNANASLGAVVMATQYNAADAAFSSKQSMENYEGAVSGKPSISIIHAVECAPNSNVLDDLYVRTGAVPAGQDQRLYDIGTFTLATSGQSSSYVIGELWVTYCVELLKPKLPATIGGGVASYHFYRTGANASNPLGTTTVNAVGSLQVLQLSSTIFYFSSEIGALYQVTMYVNASGAAASVIATPTLAGLTSVSIFQNDSQNPVQGPYPTTAGVQNMALIATYRANASTCTLSFPTNGVYGSGAAVDFLITQLDASITA